MSEIILLLKFYTYVLLPFAGFCVLLMSIDMLCANPYSDGYKEPKNYKQKLKTMKNFFIYWMYFIYYYVEILIDINIAKGEDESKIAQARLYALMTHHKVGQRYDKKYPYYYHLKMVSDFAIKFSYLLKPEDRTNAIIIALFHDLIEDCRLTYNDVKDAWGVVIADGVYACTELRGKNRKERHGPEYVRGLQESLLGTFDKLCDLIANMTMGKRTGSRMFPMYQKEYPNNRKNLYREEFNDMFIYFEKELL